MMGWYGLSSAVRIELQLILKLLRFGAIERTQYRLARFMGYVDALWDARVIELEVKQRLDALAWSAFRQCDLREVTSDAPVEVSAPAAPRVVHLLCMRGPRSSGGTSGRLQPVHTVQPMPPYARVHGRWDYESGIRCLEAGLQYISCGTGVYLREAHARTPSPAVLARCVRQRQTDSLRSGASSFVTDTAA